MLSNISPNISTNSSYSAFVVSSLKNEGMALTKELLLFLSYSSATADWDINQVYPAPVETLV